jgi:hypothetical protein
MKNCNDTIQNRTRDLPARITVSSKRDKYRIQDRSILYHPLPRRDVKPVDVAVTNLISIREAQVHKHVQEMY